MPLVQPQNCPESGRGAPPHHGAIGEAGIDMSARMPALRLGQSAAQKPSHNKISGCALTTIALALRPRRSPTSHTARASISTDAPNTAKSTHVSRSASTETAKASSLRKTAQPSAPVIDPNLRNPILEKYLTEKKLAPPTRPSVREGDLSRSPSSLFLPERELPGWRPSLTPAELAGLKAQTRQKAREAQAAKDRDLISMNTDPDPAARQRLERRLVLAAVTRRGRTTKAQKIARTERQSTFKSHALPTSVKKLQKVIRQIAGKTVEEALVQLRFSPKKVARDVIKGLEQARDEAIVARGMGIAKEVKDACKTKTKPREGAEVGVPRKPLTKEQKAEARQARRALRRSLRPTSILLKNGTRKLVRDPTEMYIDQAWVGKGEQWQTPEFRARGKTNALTHRTTTFSVLLKEEKTRMRISEEMKKKNDNRKLWLPLPDRPVTAQRQYCLW